MVDFGHTAGFLLGGIVHLTPLAWQAVWTAVSVTLVQLVFLYILYRNKLFLKV
jgi:hypothetical protein